MQRWQLQWQGLAHRRQGGGTLSFEERSTKEPSMACSGAAKGTGAREGESSNGNAALTLAPRELQAPTVAADKSFTRRSGDSCAQKPVSTWPSRQWAPEVMAALLPLAATQRCGLEPMPRPRRRASRQRADPGGSAAGIGPPPWPRRWRYAADLRVLRLAVAGGVEPDCFLVPQSMWNHENPARGSVPISSDFTRSF